MKEITLPSGAVLKLGLAPFSDSKDLYQAVLGELKEMPFSTQMQLTEVMKNVACGVFSSKKVEALIWKCMAKSLYNSGTSGDLKITPDTFEAEEARVDYVQVCMEVVQAHITPFMKGLYSASSTLLELVAEAQK